MSAADPYLDAIREENRANRAHREHHSDETAAAANAAREGRWRVHLETTGKRSPDDPGGRSS